MGKHEKTIANILSGHSDSNIRFAELLSLLTELEFLLRVKGSHHIFYKEGIEEILNLQPNGAQAKPYQVAQVRDIIVKYHLEVH